jgi:transcriptional regulator with XRE-family HTH domain
VQLEIGAKLKAARRRRGLSLRALGELTGFSASFLSQLELDQTTPSIASLSRVAQVLGLSLAKLLSESENDQDPIVRSGKSGLKSQWSRAIMHSLLPSSADERISALLVTLEPEGQSGKWPSNLPGHQFVYCLEGCVELLLDDETFELAKGDSAFYDIARKAEWKNPTRENAQLLFVSVLQS